MGEIRYYADFETIKTFRDESVKKFANKTHCHEIEDVTGLRGELDGIQSAIDSITVGDIPSAGENLGIVMTGGDVTIENGIITVNDNSHSHTVDTIDGFQETIELKADKEHTHDLYETKADAQVKYDDILANQFTVQMVTWGADD